MSAIETIPALASANLPADLSHLQQLEAEAIFIIREAAAVFEKPALLFSGGKDSITLLHLCRKAFYPARVPFPLLHIDTGHNFAETIAFRDKLVAETGVKLIVRYVEDSIKQGRVQEENGLNAGRNTLQTVTLLDAIAELGLDAAFGGGRRDEEKSRAKERFFSHRDEFGQWDPRNQRPELWQLFNGRKRPGEHFRVFPLSNWTEADVWQYAVSTGFELPSLYFSHRRLCLNRNGTLLAWSDYLNKAPHEKPLDLQVRFRTIGDMTCTGAVISNAATYEEVMKENMESNLTERGTRFDDLRSEAALEDRKKDGYF
ncbi:MAG: sulfate adenylyltransferase subunit CysD [Bacteroidota bacterium]